MSDAAQLLAHSERCFRLANGAIGPRLAEELERLAHAFEREARQIEVVVSPRRRLPVVTPVTKICSRASDQTLTKDQARAKSVV
jgi:hypothetical protein